jgi:hypothetical protein
MDTLLPYMLSAGLFLVLELLWCRPSWPHAPAEMRGGRGAAVAADRDPRELAFVQRRLDVLAAEMDLLVNDESIFARAFRYHVAQAAYEALLVDASRLAGRSTLDGPGGGVNTTMIELEIHLPLAPPREELRV